MISQLVPGFAALIAYFVTCLLVVLPIRLLLRGPTEIFRKLLHFVLLFSLPVLLYAFETWWLAVLASLLFIVFVFPILAVAERLPGFSELLTERKGGELKRSLVLAFGMFAIVIGVGWGWLDDRLLVIAVVAAWGFGDAAAALVGQRFGRHGLQGKWIEGRKSVEGTAAMFLVSFLSVGLVLSVRGGLPWYGLALVALVTAIVTTAVELFTRNGYDTFTCPLAAASVMLPLVWLWGGIPL